MSACPRLGKLFGGCRFEARHDEKLPDRGFKLNGLWDASDSLKAIKERLYIGDICTRCGEWRARQGEK